MFDTCHKPSSNFFPSWTNPSTALPYISSLLYFFIFLPLNTPTVFYPPQNYHMVPTNTTSFDIATCHLNSTKAFTGICWCTALYDIRCSNVNEVPSFQATLPNIVYGGFYLAKQNISFVPEAAFSGVRVHKIVLNFNNISGRMSGKALKGLKRILRELYLGGCGFNQMPIHLLDGMTSLERLHLWANHLSVLSPGYFSHCTNLKELILWGNKVTVLRDADLSGLWNLQKLDLDKNSIKLVENGAFRHLGSLEVLHLGENLIETLYPSMFMHLKNLKVLNLDGNRLNIIYPDAFKILSNLISLSLNNNNLSLIPGEVFAHNTKLTSIFLHRNLLEELWPNAFEYQKSLYLLNLSYNQIKDIPYGTLKENKHLKIFYIDNNLIQTVQMCVFAWNKTHPFRVLSLLGNPLSCDCELKWMSELQMNSSVSISGVCDKKQQEGPRSDGGEVNIATRHSITDFNLYRSCKPVFSKCG